MVVGILIVTIPIILYFCKQNQKLIKKIEDIKRKTFWNTIIRITMTSYIPLLIIAGLAKNWRDNPEFFGE